MNPTRRHRLALCVGALSVLLSVDGRTADVPQRWSPLIQAWGQRIAHDEPVKCGFPIIAHASRSERTLSAEARAALKGVLMRPPTQTSVRAGSFRIHFDTIGTNAPTLLDAQSQPIPGTARRYVDSTASAFAYSLSVETGVLGYPVPPADGSSGGGPEYDIYIQELGSMYGYTTPDQSGASGSKSTSFITIDNDFVFVRPASNRGLPAMRVTAAHELHHAIQIGNYGYWDNDVYFYEITSTWLEDVVYPAVNDYYNYLYASWSHYRQPERAFTSNDLIMYSRATWGHYVAKRFGVDAMRACWQGVSTARPLRAIDVALRSFSSDFASAFAEWGRWNYFTGPRANPLRYYPDGSDYPEITQWPIDFVAPSRDVAGNLEFVGTKYYLVRWGADSMTVILVNNDIEASLNGTPPTFPYTYSFNTQRVDESYSVTPLGLYAKLSVSNPAMWVSWYVKGDSARPSIDPSTLEEGNPFPSPFKADGNRRVYIPVDVSQQSQGQLFVYSSAMSLVYESATLTTTSYQGRSVFTWDGRTNFNEVAPTGVYVFVVELRDRRVTGKIALLKE